MKPENANRQIHLTVATVCEHQGKYLMVAEEVNQKKVFNQPAGHVEPGEMLTAAALRETLEETGWRVELLGLIGFSTYFVAHTDITYYRVTFIAKPIEQILDAELDPDILEAVWLDYETIRDSSALRSPLVLRDIELYRSGQSFPLTLLSEGH